jgi:predicted PurR-regulated permease PerM
VSFQTERDRIATLTFYAAITLLAYLVYRLLEPFLAPLAWAAVLVVFCHPWHARLQARWGKTRTAALSTFVVTCLIIAPSLFIMTACIRQGTLAITDLESALASGNLPRLQRAWEWAQQHLLGQPPSDLTDLAKQTTTWAAGILASQVGAVLRNVILRIVDLIVTLFAMFFLFRDADLIMDMVRRMLPFDELHRERMITEARDLVHATVTSSLVVAATQGLLGGLAFAVLAIDAPVFWGTMMAFFALLPFAGTWVIWAPAAMWLIISGEVGRGLILVGLGAGVVATVDNFLRPALLSGRTQLNGLLVFISLLGGLALFGLLGLVLGPIIVSTAAGLLKTYTAQE